MRARRSELTNPAGLLATLECELTHRAPASRAVSLALIDLDGMSRVNERYGTEVGADLLTRVGELLLDRSSGREVVAWLGGDEFAVAFPGLGPRGAARRAMTFLRWMRRMRVEPAARGVPRVRASVGGASASPKQASVRDLMGTAHSALVEAKRAGGNQLIWSLGR